MSRKSGKPPQKPLSERDRRELLNELGSVQDMLRDTADGSDDSADDGEPPVLEPEGGDGEQQMPLLQPEDPAAGESRDEANERLRQALRERPNPFLSSAARKTSPGEAPPAAPDPPAADNAASRRPATSGTKKTQATDSGKAGAAALTEEQMRALVDEVLAAWMPKIERELRDRLMERLRNQQG